MVCVCGMFVWWVMSVVHECLLYMCGWMWKGECACRSGICMGVCVCMMCVRVCLCVCVCLVYVWDRCVYVMCVSLVCVWGIGCGMYVISVCVYVWSVVCDYVFM